MWPALRYRFAARDPASRMFRRIRWGLTVWYAAAFAITLLIIGIVLYAGVRNSLLGPIDTQLQQSAQPVAAEWQGIPDGSSCPRPPFDRGLLWACFDQNGALIDAGPFTQDVPRFIDSSVAREALHDGSVTDTIDSHTIVGILRRYAVRVSDPQTGQALGVYMVGARVSDQTQALHTLLTLLLVCGSLGVLAAAAGGLFLASRSLLPVRLAYNRQRDFIANASHELRTPLTMVRADAEVLLRDRQHLNPDQVAILEDVVLEASHMASLATNMLDLAQLDAGRLHMDEDVVDLAALTSEMARRAGPLATERGIGVRVQTGSPVLVLGDRVLLEHAALILIDNAIKYNREGGSLTLGSSVSHGRAVLQVSDTGIGVTAEHLPRLGERFYQVDKARSRQSGGAGLGLSIVRGIASLHHGTFQLASDLGVGTTATISLPAVDGNRRASEESDVITVSGPPTQSGQAT